jgi:predicted nucleic acid-binding protein
VSSVVLDASVAIALVVGEPGSRAAAEAVADNDALVPEAFWVEVSSALVRKVKERSLTRRDAIASFGLLRRLVEYSIATEPLGAFAMSLALDLDHTVYDCVYLAAAVAHEAPLITADRALHAKAVEAGYGPHVRLVG